LNSIKAKIWTPKITNEVARAVRKATKLIPCEFWAEPIPEAFVALGVADAPDIAEDISAVVFVDIMET